MSIILLIVGLALAVALVQGLVFIPGPPDAELVLQAAVTKTASFNSAWLDLGRGYSPGGLGQAVAGVVSVTALDTGSGNETYSFVLEEAAPDANGDPDAGTVRAIGAALAVTATGLKVTKGFVTTRYVRLALTAGGTTPSITYTGQLNP